MKKTISSPPLEEVTTISPYGRQRRNMLKIFGAGAALITIGSACNKDDDPNPSNGGVNLGSGDVGILNYAYALEQLEAAFYEKVVSSFYTGATDTEKAYLTEIRNHEVGHREFFKAAITAAAPSSIIPSLEVDFSTIDFTSKTSVLATAQAFEDLGVTAYNGAGQLISTSGNGPAYLLLAGKIVSVEARHAALIADLRSNGTFAAAANADADGLDGARTPAEVLAIAKTYIKTVIDASNLPS
ncbi:ferritin-like domain-containing protein [Ferruginibacter sp. HRS2-29]|uniref:ferritin-like domain-containing protein n=1 Tax=Ferruginibacter sp. HRS2-29 TaxID=2487334 RepID=UPI0020CEE6D3|nr:ferritin-like domain-containing protein [Ferruginibacter sp. HRS2-29]MCP9751342.1 ferritin-like domain-containing protein [Ferruginibacter sp. HRS2-29]